MNDREKLIELIDQVQEVGIAANIPPDALVYFYNEDLADHLIANGVKIGG